MRVLIAAVHESPSGTKRTFDLPLAMSALATKRRFVAMRNLVRYRGAANSGKPSARQIYEFTALGQLHHEG